MATSFNLLPEQMNIFSDAIKSLNHIEKNLKIWHNRLSDKLKEDYEGLYESAMVHISEERADLGALFSEHIVYEVASIVAKEEEERL